MSIKNTRSLKFSAVLAIFIAWSAVGCGGGSSLQDASRGSNLTSPTVSTQIVPVITPTGTSESTTAEGPVMPTPTRMIGSDRRLAVRNECWYALNSSWVSRPSDDQGPGGNNTLSNWHYIATDGNNNGLRYVLRTYGGYVSDLIPGVGGSLSTSQIENYISQFTNDAYAMNFPSTKGVGHGLQCVSFATLILYRALNGYQFTWNWSSINPSSFSSASTAQPGDLVFYKNSSTTGHIAICVRNYGSGITVVDSNYLGHEVIGRHDVSNGTIGTTWKCYSGRGKWY